MTPNRSVTLIAGVLGLSSPLAAPRFVHMTCVDDARLGRRTARRRPARIIRSFVLIVAFGLAGCGSASTPAPGQIVFSDSNGEVLVVMNPDGTDVRSLGTDGLAPSWSPDGTQVAFERGTSGGEGGCELTFCSQIWVIGIDEIHARRLTPVSARSMAPDWSSDGERIAFSQYDSDTEQTDIYVMNVDGSNVRRLTNAPGENGDPAWSPDGKRIAFSSDRDGLERILGGEIYVMDADGSNEQRLTHTTPQELLPAWSPDGHEIAFERASYRGNYEDVFRQIVVVREDGSEERILSPRTAHDADPAWSPDGTQIAFTRFERQQIWVMDADGGRPRRLETGVYAMSCCPDWAAARD
jgi:tol-pal system beta propeller repeat protein TolB